MIDELLNRVISRASMAEVTPDEAKRMYATLGLIRGEMLRQANDHNNDRDFQLLLRAEADVYGSLMLIWKTRLQQFTQAHKPPAA